MRANTTRVKIEDQFEMVVAVSDAILQLTGVPQTIVGHVEHGRVKEPLKNFIHRCPA